MWWHSLGTIPAVPNPTLEQGCPCGRVSSQHPLSTTLRQARGRFANRSFYKPAQLLSDPWHVPKPGFWCQWGNLGLSLLPLQNFCDAALKPPWRSRQWLVVLRVLHVGFSGLESTPACPERRSQPGARELPCALNPLASPGPRSHSSLPCALGLFVWDHNATPRSRVALNN